MKKRSKPLADIPPARFGTKPADGGNLIVEVDEYAEVAADPVAAKYLRPFRGSRELVRGLDRWCLWMGDEDFDPSDITRSHVLKQRVTDCKRFREQSSPSGDAFKLKGIPHLMRSNKDRPVVDHLLIPSVVSETRPYFTAQQVTGRVSGSLCVRL
ncbi:type IIL restriction-modification enzyme MmeI [Corynebacterium urealyticum]|uniref:type IIL restriction-modification enzyme MmeI n=1 Tax=Corynebacterium urealyticum TaxID=43771 RepID=UPI002F42A264